MAVYKFFRYFVFLFLGILFILYLTKDFVKPVTWFDPMFGAIDNFYDSVLKSDGMDIQNQKYLSETADMISSGFFQNINSMKSDLRFTASLGSALKYNFNDLEYLIQEYLAHLPLFRDVLLFKDKELLYKYRNIYLVNKFIVEYSTNLMDTNLNMQVVFDQKILEMLLSDIEQKMIIRYQGKIYYADKYDSIPSVLLDKINQFTDDKGQFDFSKKERVYVQEIKDHFDAPVTLFLVAPRSANFGYHLLRLFVMMIFPLFIVLLIVLDRLLYSYLRVYFESMGQESSSGMSGGEGSQDLDDTLGWLDRFIKIEELTHSNTKSLGGKMKNISEKFSQISKNDNKQDKS
ncbi:MAG: hypothetical protein ACRCTQ_00525 [Brevinemataceae bacterium]